MTDDTPLETEMERTDNHSLRRTRNAARSTVGVYLDLAKTGEDSYQKRSLEAIAVKRALIADTLGELVESGRTSSGKTTSNERTASIRGADEELFEASGQLYRRARSKAVKNFARELRFSVFGFGQRCFF